MPDRRPNILLIMSDQHHAGILGSAGDPYVQTPALDSLAAQGVSLTNTYCPFPLCGPSRMAFMTARHSHDIDVWTNTHPLHPDIPTFAHAFTAGGYRTALVGRMHFVGHDQYHGFLERPLSDCGGTAWLQKSWALNRVLGDLVDTPGCDLTGVLKSGPGHTGYHAYDRTVTASAIDWLQQYAQQQQQEATAPFMSVVGYVSPHCPFVAPPQDYALYADRITDDDLPPPDADLHPQMRAWARGCRVDPPPPRDAQLRTRIAYYGLTTFIDRQIGRILDTLQRTGLADNTIIVYTSDHGEMLGEHGLWWKSTFYDGSSRVPLIISYPRQLPQGTRATANCSLIDIGPTLLDLAGLPPMPNVSGQSFTPLLHGRPHAWHDTAYSELANAGSATHPVTTARSIRRGPWKYNYYHQQPHELFHLTDDPGEHHNRIADPTCAHIANQLRQAILTDWDPAYVIRRLRRCAEERELIANYLRLTNAPEPIPPNTSPTPPKNIILDT